MITGMVGKIGNGKSMYCVNEMVKHKARNTKRRLAGHLDYQDTVSNIFPFSRHWDFKIWSEMIDLENASITIDECQRWFPSREWHKNTADQLAVFQQSRKDGLDLIWIAQNEGRLDAAIRELTQYIWKTKKVGPMLLLRQFEPEYPKVTTGRRLWRIDKRVWKYYDSFQHIGDKEGKGYKFGKSRGHASVAAGAELIYDRGRMIVSPNMFRIDGPRGPLYISADSAGLTDLIAEAAAWHRLTCSQLHADQLVLPFFLRSDGVLMQIDADMTLIPKPDDPDLLQMVRKCFEEEFIVPAREALKTYATRNVVVAK